MPATAATRRHLLAAAAVLAAGPAWAQPARTRVRLQTDKGVIVAELADDKAPIIAIATALDALKSAGILLRANIKFVFEGEEEAGSPHLASILAKYKELLSSDVWLICDGPVH